MIPAAVMAVTLLSVFAVSPAAAAEPKVGLGTAGSYAVLAGQAVTNTGPTVVTGNLGVSPNNAVSGFPPGLVLGGTIHQGDAHAGQAQSDLTTAYNDASGRACDVSLTGQDLGGMTLTSGVYCFSSSAQLTGTLTLDAEGVPNAVFIFQIGSTLTTASASRVALINGAQACNVYWQVGSSATLGTDTTFVGNILALTSITLDTRASVHGRVLARNGAVTLDNNTINRAECGEKVCTTTLQGGTYRSVFVPDGATCTLDDVTVRGDVTVGKGSRLFTRDGTTIGGDVTGVGARTVRLITTDVGGDVDLGGTTGPIVIGFEDCLIDPIVGGSILLHRNFGPISICDMTVGGRLELRNNRSSDISLRDNDVADDLLVLDNRGAWLDIRRNSVGGYMSVRRNTITNLLKIKDNRIVGDLLCYGNSPDPTQSGNTVGGARLGECAA